MKMAARGVYLVAGLILSVYLDVALSDRIFDITASCPSTPRGKVANYKNLCYEFIPDKRPYPEAKQLCQKHGGHVVTIDNKETQEWLASYVKDTIGWLEADMPVNSGIWIGLVRSGSRTWRWDDSNSSAPGSALGDYTNWEANEPDSHISRSCSVFGDATDFKWRSSVCSQAFIVFSVICQYEGADGIFGSKAAVIGTVVAAILVVALCIGVISFCYCYKKRRALHRQLNGSQESPSVFKDHRILNTDNNIDIESNCSDNQHAPPHYGDVSESTPNLSESQRSHNYNYNIIVASAFERPKVKDKDLSLSDVRHSTPIHCASGCRPPMNRSVSEPAGSAPPQRYSSIPSAPPLEDDIDEDVALNEEYPLRREISEYSNNLS